MSVNCHMNAIINEMRTQMEMHKLIQSVEYVYIDTFEVYQHYIHIGSKYIICFAINVII